VANVDKALPELLSSGRKLAVLLRQKSLNGVDGAVAVVEPARPLIEKPLPVLFGEAAQLERLGEALAQVVAVDAFVSGVEPLLVAQ